MIANIIYDDKILKFKLDNDLQVKDILQNLNNEKEYPLDLEKNKVTRIMDESLHVLEDEEFIYVQKDSQKIFYLFQTTESYNEQVSEESEPIEDLITKVTNAKEKLKIKNQPNLSLRRRPNFIRIHSIYEPGEFHRGLSNFSMRPLAIFTNSNLNLDNIHYMDDRDYISELNEVEPDQNLVTDLLTMGFPEDKCKRALMMARNDFYRAADILINDELDYVPISDSNRINDEQESQVFRMEVDDYLDFDENNDNIEETEENNDYNDYDENSENEDL